MEKRILFINDKKSMIANALISALQKADFEVTQVHANIYDVSNAGSGANAPAIWLLYLQEPGRSMEDVLTYIKEEMEERRIRLYAIGMPDELEDLGKEIPLTSLRGTFTRPFRADDVVDRITMEFRSSRKPTESKRILVVDDDATTLRTYKELLSAKYRVYTANSGMNAIQMLVNTTVDLILLDYEMPVIKGPQILEMLRSESHTKDIPVMFLTSKNDRESIMQVMKLNPANYLLKSLSHSEIMQKIDAFFESKEG